MNRSTPDIDVAPSPLNARYTAYLDQRFLPIERRKLFLLAGFAAGLVIAAASLALRIWLGREQAMLVLPVGMFLALQCGMILRGTQKNKKHHERLRRVALRGVPVTGYLVQANEALFKPGPDNLPCLVLFSFQPEVDGDPDYMSSLAHRVFSLKNTQNAPADHRYVADLTTNERAVFYRRRKLPLSFTDGSTIFCADLWIKRAHLTKGHLTSPFLPCFAEPGENGGLELIPAFLLGETAPPPPLLERGKKPG